MCANYFQALTLLLCHDDPHDRNNGVSSTVMLEHSQPPSQLLVWGAWWACALTRMVSAAAYEKYRRAMGPQHVIEEIGAVMELLCPTPAVPSSLL